VTIGQWVLVVALVGAVGFGFYRAAVDGRFRGTHRVRGVDEGIPEPEVAAVLAQTEYADSLGERATLLQFSSAFCAPCRVARRVLGEVAADHPGVVHLEIDAEHHLELVRRVGVLRTPTTLVLDSRGREVSRAAGAPTKAQVVAVLDALR
jgi:thiol-disulfide isomerase/thioredoxin